MTKKHFYFLITSSKPATYGGRKETANIYTVKRGAEKLAAELNQ